MEQVQQSCLYYYEKEGGLCQHRLVEDGHFKEELKGRKKGAGGCQQRGGGNNGNLPGSVEGGEYDLEECCGIRPERN